MAGISYSDLITQIRNYSEVDSNVLTTAVLENIILNAQYRIMRDIPIDADRKITQDNLVEDQEHANLPAGALFVRAVEVADSTSAFNNPIFLQKRDVTFLDEFNGARATGRPKYYAMKGGATGNTNTTSGAILLSPIPDSTYVFKFHYNAIPSKLEASSNETNFISLNFPNGLLYAALVETYGYLKGPTDMLQLYEGKYKQEIEKFGGEQIGRRRRDDYTDGTVRIPVNSPTP
jgi:hypothetical protein